MADQKKTNALVIFDERRNEVFFLDFRVFIQGTEVTQWITGAVTINRANRDGPGTASFTLDNVMDRFVLTEENLCEDKWRDTTDRYSEAAKHSIYLYKTGAQEVTLDRVFEMVSVLFDRNFDLANTKSKKQLRGNLGQRKRATRGSQKEDLASDVAVKETMDQLPKDLFLTADGEQKVLESVKYVLLANGETEKDAERAAAIAVREQKNRITRANKKHPNKRVVSESNIDKKKASTKGRHKRQKTIRNPVDSDTGDRRWPLQERSVIFHKNDPIRIFIHNPLSEGRLVKSKLPTGEEVSSKGFWLYGFTGFIDTYPVNSDYLTGSSTIQIQCYDIRSIMQKMRVNQNVALSTTAPEPLFKDRSSIFADLLVPSRWGQAFANLKFEDAMSMLCTGTNLQRKGQGRKFGVGNLAVGKIITYPAKGGVEDENGDKTGSDPLNRSTLEAWHSLCINGPSDISDKKSVADLTPLTDSMVEVIGRGTTTDGPYSPLNSYVHFLLPKDGTAARTLTQIAFDAGSEQRDWVSRFEIITDYCARLDYEMTVIGNGDIVFEFPMYDFLPSDFGDWRSVFEVDQHLISGEVSDEGGDIVTALIVTGAPPVADIDKYSNAPQSKIPRGVIQSSIMAARVGVTVDNHSLPFVQNQARLRSLGMIEFQKRMANANQLSMDFGFRPFITPNRPMMNLYEKRMGLTSSITETFTLFGSATTSASVRFIRQVRADGSFRFVTGGKSMPISYRDIFPGNRKSVGNAKVGVRTTMEVDGDPGTLDNNDTASDDASTKQQCKNEDRPPPEIAERRPGTYFALAPSARRIAEIVAQTIDDRFLLNNTPVANGTSFSIRARDADGMRLFSKADRTKIAKVAKDNGYILIDTRQKFMFEPRRSGQPDFIERPDNG